MKDHCEKKRKIPVRKNGITKILEELCSLKRESLIANEKIICLINKMEVRIMSIISDFAARQNAYNDKLDQAHSGLTDDIQAMKEIIEKFQNTPGAITPEDQALLDELETRAATAVAKAEALDNLTPPAPPVE